MTCRVRKGAAIDLKRAVTATKRATTVTERAGAASVRGMQVRMMGRTILKRRPIDATRCIQTWQKECLDHVVACEGKHLRK